MTITICLNRPYKPIPPVLESPDTAAHEWRDVLRWCYFINKPAPEILAGCGYAPVYLPFGLNPARRLPEKAVRKIVRDKTKAYREGLA